MSALKKLFARPAILRGYVDLLSAARFRGERQNTTPLIFFVHVPKTAGSTVNSFLQEFLPNGRSHCEGFFHNKKLLNSAANSCDWLSGHVDLSTAEAVLGQSTNRPVRYFSCMRNPIDHVMSHYNWVIEIFYRGGSFYEKCPPVIKEISEIVRASANDASSIAANLERFGGLFLNTQSRWILGHSFNWDTGTLRERLNRYEAIVDTSDVSTLLADLLGHPIDKTRMENVSPYHFDPAAFHTAQMKEFLREKNSLDETLYQTLSFQSREKN